MTFFVNDLVKCALPKENSFYFEGIKQVTSVNPGANHADKYKYFLDGGYIAYCDEDLALAYVTPKEGELIESIREEAASVIAGVSKDEPRVTNEYGGSQSRVLYDFTLADPKAMFEMCKVLKEGADKYGAENWRFIPIEDHLNHMLIHAYAYLAGDKSDEHLSHIMCRALFAQGVAVQSVEDLKRAERA
jgi:hypothetical protein